MILSAFILLLLGSRVTSFPDTDSLRYVVGKERGDFMVIKEFAKPTSIGEYSFKLEIYNKTRPAKMIRTRTRLVGSNDCLNWTELCDSIRGFRYRAVGLDVIERWTVNPHPQCRQSFFCYGISIHYTIENSTKPLAVSHVEIVPGPSECCVDPTNCPDYRGHVHQTRSGVECQAWSQDEPQDRSDKVKGIYHDPEQRKSFGLKANYCRDPTGLQRPWCYTKGTERWEDCHIPTCPERPRGKQ